VVVVSSTMTVGGSKHETIPGKSPDESAAPYLEKNFSISSLMKSR
jgi:hypothetical protein